MFIKDLLNQIGKEVSLRGWVYNIRSSGAIMFLEFRDGTGFIQVICDKGKVKSEVWKKVEKITLESSVEITGEVKEHPKKKGEFELHLKDIKIYQISEEYPIGKKEHGSEFLLDHRHLWLRSRRQWAIQRVRDTLIRATYDWLHQNNFIKIDAPILTPAACEGTTTLFEVDYFDLGKAYLSQSGQLYLETAIASHGRVFDFGPTFRAEKSKTRRHLTEFWMMDAEMAFCDYEENMKIQEELVNFIVQKVLKENLGELEVLGRNVEPLKKIKPPFFKMTYKQAIKKLQGLGSDIKEGEDLGGDDETLLTKDSDKPIFIEKFPAQIKAFYMKRDAKNPDLTLCNDLLAPEGCGEIIGGSQREDNYDELVKRIKEHNLPEHAFGWYLDLRKYGSVPHSGFGFGLERIVAWVCGLKHIREAIPFPRLINRVSP